MIELEIETLFKGGRETLNVLLRRIRIGMTDQTHLRARRQKLVSMTVNAGRVVRKNRSDRVIGRPLMTIHTTKRRVLGARMFESRIVEIVPLRGYGGRRQAFRAR